MPSCRLLITFVLLHSSLIISQAAPPPELTLLRQHYDKVIAENATAPFEANKAELDKKFIAALDNAVAAAKQTGKLDDVLAIQDDKKRLTDKLPIPDDDDKTPEALKRLRVIYREELAKLEAKRTASLEAILPGYIAKLTEVEATLVKNDRIEEAKELRAFREALAQSGPLSPLSGAPQTPAAAETAQGTVRATPQTPNVKGDDRKAAEWLLRCGAYFLIEEKGKKFQPTKPEDLPKGKFSIISIGLNDRDGKEPITAEAYTSFAGLQQLTSFNTDFVPVADANLAFLASCPALQVVSIKREAKITDAVVDYLINLRSLQHFGVTDVASFTGATLHKLAKNKNLTRLEFIGTGFDDHGAEAVSQIKQLMSLTFESAKNLSDAGILQLYKLPDLLFLSVCNAGCTAEGLAAAKLKIEHLDFNKLGGNHMPHETAPIIGPAYPGVTSVRFAQSENIKREDIEALAHFKSLTSFNPLSVKDSGAWAGLAAISTLEKLWIDRNPFSDVEIDHLLAVPKLTELTLGNVDVTDAGLLKLVGMKRLKKLGLKPCPQITEAGLAKFKKARPDVQVEK